MVSIASFGTALCRKLAWVARASDGTVALYVTVLLPFLIGGALLTVDAARLYSLNTSMQAGADALALAGAAELDGQSQPAGNDSIARANNAITNLVANKMLLGDANKATITVASITFLSNLPPSDVSAITGANITTDPAVARYVQVRVKPADFTTFFPATFIGAVSNTTTTGAIATAGGPIAGGGRQLCLGPVAPMFICNPYEGSDTSIYQALNDPAILRRQIKLQAGSGTFFPGNYGWLDTPELGNGATALRDALALIEPISGGDCRVQRTTVSQKTGNVQNANDAINTRFDLWNGPFNNGNKNAAYAPALNVRKGYKPGNGANGACNPSQPLPNINQLPPDSAFPYAGGRMGNGNWDINAYWNNNYGTAPPNGWSNNNLPSRYAVYRYELANGLTATAAVGGNAKGEKGAPQCYSGGTTPSYDRRLIYVPLINCTSLNITGNSTDLGVPFAYGKFFFTQPIPDPTQPDAGTIYAEFVGLAGSGAMLDPDAGPVSAVQEGVQLYR